MAHDVFISYSAEDKPTADAVCATLEARHIRCWIAPRDVLPGEDYARVLIEAIYASRVMILVFSSNSNNSPHVMRELERAASNGIPILPLRIEDVRPSGSMEYFIGRTHWLDALTPPLEKHLRQLAETVHLLLARTASAVGVGKDAEATAAPPASEAAAADSGMERPPPRGALQVVRRWGEHPIARLALGIGAIAVVTIIVLLALLSGGGDGDSGDGDGPAVVEETPVRAVDTPTIAADTPTVAVTTTPSPPSTAWVPEVGTYSGTTTQGSAIEFDVVEGSRGISRLEFEIEGTCPGCTCTVKQTTTMEKPWPIVDNALSYSAHEFDLSVTFDSATTASGYVIVHQSGSAGQAPCNSDRVTWTASLE